MNVVEDRIEQRNSVVRDEYLRVRVYPMGHDPPFRLERRLNQLVPAPATHSHSKWERVEEQAQYSLAVRRLRASVRHHARHEI
jgi:hypothetical protein